MKGREVAPFAAALFTALPSWPFQYDGGSVRGGADVRNSDAVKAAAAYITNNSLAL